MANIIKLTASDGSTVEFYDEIKAQGGVKDVYFSTDKTYVVAFYRNPTNANDKARLENIVGVYREKIFVQTQMEITGMTYLHGLLKWWNGKDSRVIVIPFYNKKFFFTGIDAQWPFIKNGQEKNGKWFSSAKLINKFVPADQKGTISVAFAYVFEDSTWYSPHTCRRTSSFGSFLQ